MTAAMGATAVQQLAALEDRIGQLQHSRDALTSQRAGVARDLARAIADGAPEKGLRALSDAVEALDREAAGLPDAIQLLDADLRPLREAARRERQAKAEAEVARLDRAFTASVHETHAALREAVRTYLPQHHAMHAARAASIEARRAALRLAGADQREVYYAAPDEPRFGDDGDFYTLGRLLAKYGAGI